MNMPYLVADAALIVRGLIPGAVGAIVGIMGTYLLLRWRERVKLDTARNEAERLLSESKSEAEVIRKTARVDAQDEFLKGQEQLRRESDAMRAELKEIEKRVTKREDNLEAKLDTLETKERNLEQSQKKLAARADEAAAREKEATQLVAQRRERLLEVGGMTVREARQTVLDELQVEL